MQFQIIDPNGMRIVRTVNPTNYDLPLRCFNGESGSISCEKLESNYNGYLLSIVLDSGKRFFTLLNGKDQGNQYETTLDVYDAVQLLDGLSAVIRTGSSSSSHSDTDTENVIFAYYYHALGYYQSVANYIVTQLCNDKKLKYGTVSDINTSESPWRWQRINQLLTEKGYVFSDFGNYFGYSIEAGNTYEHHVRLDCLSMARALQSCGIGIEMDGTMTGNIFGTGWSNVYDVATLPKFHVTDIKTNVESIVFGDGHAFLDSESYNDDVCSHVRVMTTRNGTAVEKQADFYLADDMSITNDVSRQIDGYTKTLTVNYVISQASPSDALLADIQAVFDQNSWEHSIRFWSDKLYDIGQPVRIKLAKGIIDTTIDKVSIKSGDNRLYYQCGGMNITASEKLRDTGWKYGRRLPVNPKAGDIFILEE